MQTNKAKIAVETFDRVQSIDSLKILKRLDRLSREAGKVLSILLQCNSGEDPNKFGFAVDEMEQVLELALSLEHVRVEGLMTIAPLDDAPEVAQRAFGRLRQLRDRLEGQFSVALRELSMGMTGDLEYAIEAGSTQIRVGSAYMVLVNIDQLMDFDLFGLDSSRSADCSLNFLLCRHYG